VKAKAQSRRRSSAQATPRGLTFQQLCLDLLAFWGRRGCVLQQPYDVEVGAGTMAPETFLRVLGPEPYRVAYIQPSRRPADGRYGENPNRLYKHLQLQVILKPSPADVQDVYLASLEAIGIDLRHHDIRFEEDNWESPTLGAWGIGWQVLLDGLEITQFTYFQQCGGLDLDPVCSEEERQLSVYSFEMADPVATRRQFELAEAEAGRVLEGWTKAKGEARRRHPLLAAYDLCLKCSHLFNLLDARGVISVTERAAMIGRIRQLACRVAAAWLEQQGAAPAPDSEVRR
jgi:glycyl-tRNA synthetase alpha chain